MGCPTEVEIGDNLVFTVCTHDPDTGVLTDADAVPSYRVYEDETGTAILTGDMSKLDDANTTGFYSESIACTSGNGFENGKTYTIYIAATVDSDQGGICYGFKAYDQRKADSVKISGDATAADNAELAFDGTGYGFTGCTIPTVTTLTGHTAQTGDNYARIGANGSSLSAIPWNSSWDAEVQSEATDALNAYDPPSKAELDSGLAGLNDPTAAAIADAVWDEASTGHTDAGKAGAQLWTDIDAVLGDTNELQGDWTNGGRLDLLIDAIKAVTDILQLEAGTNYIKSVPQDLEDVSIGDGDTLGSGYAGEALRWLRWFIKNTWDVDTTPDPDEMNIYKDNGTTKGYCFQVYTSSNHNYRKVVACS